MTKPKFLGGLGFRDIELFNIALLAKQAWRILQELDSLSGRMLKAVYFPNNEFLDAELGSSPSRIWRSILDGRECLHKGLIRRIGNGELTEVWNMNWLPNVGSLRPLRLEQTNQVRWVSEIINHSEARWDVEKINQLFTPMDVDFILSIPLSTRNRPDFWAWNFEKKNGVFTVKSAYRLLVNMKEPGNAFKKNDGGRSDTRKSEEWTNMWQLQVPSKARVFLWRLMKQSLPTKDVLHHRNMADQSICTLCGTQDSWKHSLIENAIRQNVCGPWKNLRSLDTYVRLLKLKLRIGWLRSWRLCRSQM